MKQKKILHIISPDKFTIPFIHFINKEFNPDEHLFLCSIKPDEKLLALTTNVTFLHSPYKKNLIRNALIFHKSILGSSQIILHGNSVLFYFMLFPWVLKRTYWIIYGYELGHSEVPGNKTEANVVHSYIKNFVLKRIYGHITHIKGDSELANILFKSSAKFYYSPMYLSNVVTKCQHEKVHRINESGVKKILVGNSTSPTNNHSEIFEMLLPYKGEDILIYSPLSYGIYSNYRDEVIRNGKNLFEEKFIPITKFMNLDEYKSFLKKMDIAIFNHDRQEAMGVTLMLLSMGKVVYMSRHTTSYRSLTERGIGVFDNALIAKDGLFKERDVSMNPNLVYHDYCYEKLISSLKIIFND